MPTKTKPSGMAHLLRLPVRSLNHACWIQSTSLHHAAVKGLRVFTLAFGAVGLGCCVLGTIGRGLKLEFLGLELFGFG